MSKIQYPDDNRRYVIVVNRSGLTPIRHVVNNDARQKRTMGAV